MPPEPVGAVLRPEAGLFDPTEGLPLPAAENVADGYAWGIDPGTRAVAFAFDPGVETVLVELPRVDGAERLGRAYDEVEGAARALAERFPPACIWVEQGSGEWITPSFTYMVGVIQAAVHNALRLMYEHPVPVWTLTSAEWKKRALGNGAAKKQDVLAWALREGARRNVSQDEADALGIARGGRRMMA